MIFLCAILSISLCLQDYICLCVSVGVSLEILSVSGCKFFFHFGVIVEREKVSDRRSNHNLKYTPKKSYFYGNRHILIQFE